MRGLPSYMSLRLLEPIRNCLETKSENFSLVSIPSERGKASNELANTRCRLSSNDSLKITKSTWSNLKASLS